MTNKIIIWITYVMAMTLVVFIIGTVYLATKYMTPALIVATIFAGMCIGALATVSIYSFFFIVERPKN